MSLYIDLTEFLTNPITTGIQRIAGEICKYLPLGKAVPICLHEGRYVALSPKLIAAVGRFFAAGGSVHVDEIRRLGAPGNGHPITISSTSDIVLVPEVFMESRRLHFFSEMPDSILHRHRFIVYDLLPATHPQYFWPEMMPAIFAYHKILRRAICCGFISEDTRNQYYARLVRTNERGGIVLPLGADAFGPRATHSLRNRPLTFSIVATIEPRKNHHLILEAFEPLWRQIAGLQLLFIGKVGWVSSEFAQKLRELAVTNSGFHQYSECGDDAIRNHVQKSRATIYVSSAEGYGLPPVESLWVGTPVIASTTIPSLKGLGSDGIHFVEPLNAADLTQAVLSFLKDDYANRKAEETLRVNLPTWRSFTQEVLRWCLSD